MAQQEQSNGMEELVFVGLSVIGTGFGISVLVPMIFPELTINLMQGVVVGLIGGLSSWVSAKFNGLLDKAI